MLLSRTAGAVLIAVAMDIAPQQTTAELFDDAVLHTVQLFFNSPHLTILRQRFGENIYMPADIVIDGTRIRNVAVRMRGAASRNPNKMGLRLDFNFYTPGRRFRGLR